MAKSTATKVRRRSPGEGSVYRFRNGYCGAISWTDAAGTRQRRTVTATTSEEARDKLDELRREVKRATATGAAAGGVGGVG